MKKVNEAVNEAEEFETAEESAMDYVDETGESKESKDNFFKKAGNGVKATGKWLLNHGARFGIAVGAGTGVVLSATRLLGYSIVPSEILEGATVSDVKEAVAEVISQGSEVVEKATETISDVVSDEVK